MKHFILRTELLDSLPLLCGSEDSLIPTYQSVKIWEKYTNEKYIIQKSVLNDQSDLIVTNIATQSTKVPSQSKKVPFQSKKGFFHKVPS